MNSLVSRLKIGSCFTIILIIVILGCTEEPISPNENLDPEDQITQVNGFVFSESMGDTFGVPDVEIRLAGDTLWSSSMGTFEFVSINLGYHEISLRKYRYHTIYDYIGITSGVSDIQFFLYPKECAAFLPILPLDSVAYHCYRYINGEDEYYEWTGEIHLSVEPDSTFDNYSSSVKFFGRRTRGWGQGNLISNGATSETWDFDLTEQYGDWILSDPVLFPGADLFLETLHPVELDTVRQELVIDRQNITVEYYYRLTRERELVEFYYHWADKGSDKWRELHLYK